MIDMYKLLTSVLLIIFCFHTNIYSKNFNNTFNKSNEEIIITSDNFVLDYQKGYAAYSKNVNLTQVNKKLHADNLYIYFEKKNAQASNTQLKLITAFNNSQTPVVYTETNVSKPIKAMAHMIKFDPISNKIIFEKNALIEQNNKILSSELIYYDLKKEIVYMPKINKQRSTLLLGAL